MCAEIGTINKIMKLFRLCSWIILAGIVFYLCLFAGLIYTEHRQLKLPIRTCIDAFFHGMNDGFSM